MASVKEIDDYCSLCMDINCTGCEYHDVHFRNVKRIDMTTIKSFTSLEQSKKLAEILPIESADMYFTGHQSIIKPKEWEYRDIPNIRSKYISFDDKRIFYPCWSLAALLSVLPNNKNITTTLSRGGWKIEPVEYIDKWFCEYEDDNEHTKDITVTADNPVDACVAMIERLHELKML